MCWPRRLRCESGRQRVQHRSEAMIQVLSDFDVGNWKSDWTLGIFFSGLGALTGVRFTSVVIHLLSPAPVHLLRGQQYDRFGRLRKDPHVRTGNDSSCGRDRVFADLAAVRWRCLRGGGHLLRCQDVWQIAGLPGCTVGRVANILLRSRNYSWLQEVACLDSVAIAAHHKIRV